MKSVRCSLLVAGVMTSLATAVAVLPVHRPPAGDSECDTTNTVVFDRTDAAFSVRTMVIQDTDKQRMLVLTDSTDHSRPCQLRWWLDHNPQGVIQCSTGAAASGHAEESSSGANGTAACLPGGCLADVSHVELGYVRTMLVSAAYAPVLPRARLSAICIALGCRTRITHTHVPGTFLEDGGAPSSQPGKPREVHWAPRARAQKMLVIGLGTSTMALWLRRNLPDTELHVAELLPGVAAAAPCFGLNANDPKLHIHVGDGREFLAGSADGSYDSILVDAFDANASLPVCFRTQEFFAVARRKLAAGGALVLNLLLGGKDSLRVVRSLKTQFDDDRVFVGEAPGAEGIQNIVTAFATGSLRGPGASPASPPAATTKWLADARFRPIRSDAFKGVAVLEDTTVCPATHGKL
jgi:hypothetical protein